MKERLLAFLLAFLFFAAFTPHMLDYLRPPTGDEVFYLITAQSMLYDRDLDETNQFQSRSWLEFYPSCAEYSAPGWKGFTPPGDPCNPKSIIQPENTHTPVKGTYTKHGLGLSLIIAPAFALGNRLGVMFLLNGLAALLALNIFLLAWEASGRRRIAWLCWAVLSFTAPVLSYAYLIFPQLTGALCILYAFRRARQTAQWRAQGEKGRANNIFQMAGVGLCLGLLPWLHYLYLLPVAVIFAYLFLGGRKWPGLKNLLDSVASKGGYLAFFLVTGIFAVLYLFYTFWLYGSPLPRAEDHHGFSNPIYFLLGFFGLLFDQKYGLLMYNPLYLIPVAWLFHLWFRRQGLSGARRSEFYWLLAIIVPYYLVVADYARWWGQWCPPARYLLPVAPLLALPLAQALLKLNGNFVKWYFRVAATWAGLVAFAFLLDPRLSYHWEDTNPSKLLLWLQNNIPFLKGANLGNFFPSYVNLIEPLTPVFWFAHAAWFGLALWLGWRLVRRVEK